MTPELRQYVLVKTYADGTYTTEFFRSRTRATEWAEEAYNKRNKTQTLEAATVYEQILNLPCKTHDGKVI